MRRMLLVPGRVSGTAGAARDPSSLLQGWAAQDGARAAAHGTADARRRGSVGRQQAMGSPMGGADGFRRIAGPHSARRPR